MRRCLKQFPWYARLIAGAVIVLLTALAATAPAVAGNAKPTMAATDPQKRLAAKTEVVFERGTLVLIYDGKIAPGMAEFITDEFNKYRDSSHRVMLYINSPGGSIEAGEQVIAVLQAIRQIHMLQTVVMHGWTCASMCVPIFLQGKERIAAGASVWVFHDATTSLNQAGSKVTIEKEETLRLFRRYFVGAGVQVAWINHALGKIDGGRNYWQTGNELIAAKSSIITDVFGDVTERLEVQPEPRQPQRPSGK